MSVTMAYALVLVLGAVCAFLCGSIPFAIVVGKLFYGVDVREHGSGNTGATNVARTLGAGPGVAVMLLDAAKGALGVLIMMGLLHLFEARFSPVMATMLTVGWSYDIALLLASLAAIMGHVFSPFLGFHGGKGASTAFGSVFVIMPWAALIAFGFFALVGFLTRYISIGSMCAAISLPITTAIFYSTSLPYIVFSCTVCVIVLIAHKSNIRRLLHHEESKFSFGGSEGESDRDKGGT